MWLVLCAPEDAAALWAYQGLRSRGLSPLRLITAESLVYSPRSSHRLGHSGASVDMTLSDGSSIRGDEVHGVLNRLMAVPTEHLRLVSPEDRDYAVQEITALVTSWLYCLPGLVLNRPTAVGLSGRWRHDAEWHALANAAGLPTKTFHQGPTARVASSPPGHHEAEVRETVFVVGDQLVHSSTLPNSIAEACQHLARLAGAGLLGIDLWSTPEGVWRFAAATTLPQLMGGGEKLLDALASTLRGDEHERHRAAVRYCH